MIAALLVLAGFSGAALACPGTYASADCDDPGDFVCTSPSGTQFLCDLTIGSGMNEPELWAVLNEDDALCDPDADYCVWGTARSGVDFCCPLEQAGEFSLLVQGSNIDDHIYFFYDGEEVSYDLDNYSDEFTFEGQVNADAGDDEIWGSRSNLNAFYHDDLRGEGGADTIYGQAGFDEIDGGTEADTIEGNQGNDTIHGGDGNDTITGGDQDDTIFGDAGDDMIAGNAGVDTIYGSAGDDNLCGDNGNDTLHGGDDEDTLWGGADDGGTADVGNGNDPTSGSGDTCDSGTTETRTGCETVSSFSRGSTTCP